MRFHADVVQSNFLSSNMRETHQEERNTSCFIIFVFKYARNTARGEKHKLQALLQLLCSSKRKETQTPSFGVWVLWVTQTRCWLRLLCPVRHSRVSYRYHFCSSTIAQSCVLRLQFLHEHSCTVKCWNIPHIFLLQTYWRRIAEIFRESLLLFAFVIH